MASEAEEQHRADMLRERREAGDKAWSPSKAREALRAYARMTGGIGARALEGKAETSGSFDSSVAFSLFCRGQIGFDLIRDDS